MDPRQLLAAFRRKEGHPPPPKSRRKKEGKENTSPVQDPLHTFPCSHPRGKHKDWDRVAQELVKIAMGHVKRLKWNDQEGDAPLGKNGLRPWQMIEVGELGLTSAPKKP